MLFFSLHVAPSAFGPHRHVHLATPAVHTPPTPLGSYPWGAPDTTSATSAHIAESEAPLSQAEQAAKTNGETEARGPHTGHLLDVTLFSGRGPDKVPEVTGAALKSRKITMIDLLFPCNCYPTLHLWALYHRCYSKCFSSSNNARSSVLP